MSRLPIYSIKIAIIQIIIIFSFCSEAKTEPETIIRPVRYQQVFVTGGSRIRTFSGLSRAGTESRLSFKVPGTVQTVTVEVGDRVRVGDLIAVLSDEDYQLRAQQAEAALDQSQAQSRNANASYERVRGLYENNNASRADLDAARSAYESTSAAVDAAERSLELAHLQLSYCKLTAPYAGSIAEVTIEENENVSAGRVVVLLTSGTRPEVRVGIPESLILLVHEGDIATVSFDALPNKEFQALITEVGVSASGAVTTFPVLVRLVEALPDVRSGMAAEVSFRFESTENRDIIVVPSQAVGEDRNGRFTFVVEPNEPGFGTVQRRNISVGELTVNGLEVVEGLQDGDLVVTAGMSKIHHDMSVRLLGTKEN